MLHNIRVHDPAEQRQSRCVLTVGVQYRVTWARATILYPPLITGRLVTTFCLDACRPLKSASLSGEKNVQKFNDRGPVPT